MKEDDVKVPDYMFKMKFKEWKEKKKMINIAISFVITAVILTVLSYLIFFSHLK